MLKFHKLKITWDSEVNIDSNVTVLKGINKHHSKVDGEQNMLSCFTPFSTRIALLLWWSCPKISRNLSFPIVTHKASVDCSEGLSYVHKYLIQWHSPFNTFLHKLTNWDHVHSNLLSTESTLVLWNDTISTNSSGPWIEHSLLLLTGLCLAIHHILTWSHCLCKQIT